MPCFSPSLSFLVAATRTEHVFIISFDGGNPTIMQQAEMPNFKRLAAEGAYTWQARTILPSKTLPSHTAMLTGVDIAKHQIDWNDFFPLPCFRASARRVFLHEESPRAARRGQQRNV